MVEEEREEDLRNIYLLLKPTALTYLTEIISEHIKVLIIVIWFININQHIDINNELLKISESRIRSIVEFAGRQSA